MRFKLDENLPAEAADLLRDAGYDAVTVLEQEMSGETDASVAAVCEQEGRVLVTLDTDLADLRTYPPEDYSDFFVLSFECQVSPRMSGCLCRFVSLPLRWKLDWALWFVRGRWFRSVSTHLDFFC